MARLERHEVVARLTTNQNSARISLGQRLEHIQELRLDEYAIRAPNGGAVTPSLWRLWFNGRLYTTATTNAPGKGYPIVIDNASLTHVIYTRPRVISTQSNGGMDVLEILIEDEAGNAVTFADATFYFTFVCGMPRTDYANVMHEHYKLGAQRIDHNAAYTTGLPGIDKPL